MEGKWGEYFCFCFSIISLVLIIVRGERFSTFLKKINSVLKLQHSIRSKLDIVLIESLIKKNKVKGQNSIAGLGLKPQPSPISHEASFQELSMILYLDTFLAFPLRMLDNGPELNAIVTYVCFLYLL
jgi:hypothetical protein